MAKVELNLNPAMLEVLDDMTGQVKQGGVFASREAGLEWVLSFYLMNMLIPYYGTEKMSTKPVAVFKQWLKHQRAVRRRLTKRKSSVAQN